jgi:hypothetical protein
MMKSFLNLLGRFFRTISDVLSDYRGPRGGWHAL